MKKAKSSPKPYPIDENPLILKVEEPEIGYPNVKRFLPTPIDFSYNKFEKIASTLPFTLTDWASILHLSERTLQRYAKDNKNFEGIYVDRILQIEKIINLGLEVFESPDALYKWLKTPKQVMGEEINFNSLNNTEGIYHIKEQLGRIQQGVYA